MTIQKLFKPYIVRRKNGQCQVLIPLVELDDLCEKIEAQRGVICAGCNRDINYCMCDAFKKP